MSRNALQSKLVRAAKEGWDTAGRMISLRKVPIVPKRIFFATYQDAYTCNCKYIAEKILEEMPEYELVFRVSKEVCSNREAYGIPRGIRLVEPYTQECFRMQASAAFWIDNGLNCIWKKVPKRPGQIYLNTWHGSLGIKRLDGSWHWRAVARYGNRVIDYFLTNSAYDEEVFSRSFWPDVRHLAVGHPRNDILFAREKWDALRRKVYDSCGIACGVHTLLYAPTFRDAGEPAAMPDFAGVVRACAERFGGEWQVLTRCHYHDRTKRSGAEADAVDVSDYPDMQELMAAVDAGVTDYSSWIFDFVFTEKPAFLYAEDIADYGNARGFYYPLTETPFAAAENISQLCVNIKEFDNTVYERRCREFLAARGCYEKGDACGKVAAFIRNHTQ